jgi:hypothetical protein
MWAGATDAADVLPSQPVLANLNSEARGRPRFLPITSDFSGCSGADCARSQPDLGRALQASLAPGSSAKFGLQPAPWQSPAFVSHAASTLPLGFRFLCIIFCDVCGHPFASQLHYSVPYFCARCRAALSGRSSALMAVGGSAILQQSNRATARGNNRGAQPKYESLKGSAEHFVVDTKPTTPRRSWYHPALLNRASQFRVF